MKVDKTTATFSARYGERIYNFCAQGCLLAFAKEPEKYVDQASGPLHIELVGRNTGTEAGTSLIQVRGLHKTY